MDLRLLRSFVMIAEEMHFGRSAERLGIAQQSLSAQIKRLEADLGCSLFERGANRIRLTAAGHVLLGRADLILSEVDSAVESTRRAARGEAGTLRIGHCSAALRDAVPSAVRAVKERYPEAGLTLRDMRASEQLVALERGEIDIGFSYRPIDERLFDGLDIHEDVLMVGVHVTHHLANVSSVDPRLLADEPYIALTAGLNSCREATDGVLHAGGRERTVAFEVGDKHSAASLVGTNLGFMVLPALATLPFPNVTFRPLESPGRLRFAAIWSRRHGASPLREHVLAVLRSMTDAPTATSLGQMEPRSVSP